MGGLTPSLATLVKTKEHTDLSVISMVRPRGAGFLYSEDEYEIMIWDCKLLMEHGSDGIAFGFLTQDFKIDENRTKKMVEQIHFHRGEAVFHRAFDCVRDPFSSIETLIELGVDRVLTSGLENTAIHGVELLRELQQCYHKEIQILAGSGIRENNARHLIERTGINQIHSSCKIIQEDVTTRRNNVSYGYCEENECGYESVSIELVKQLLEAVR